MKLDGKMSEWGQDMKQLIFPPSGIVQALAGIVSVIGIGRVRTRLPHRAFSCPSTEPLVALTTVSEE